MHATSLRLCPTLCDPVDCSPPGSSVHGDSPGRNTGVNCHFLIQGIFLTEDQNPCPLLLLLWQVGSLPPAPQILTLMLKAFYTHTASQLWTFSISIPIPYQYLENSSFIQDLVLRSSSLQCPTQLSANALFQHFVSCNDCLYIQARQTFSYLRARTAIYSLLFYSLLFLKQLAQRLVWNKPSKNIFSKKELSERMDVFTLLWSHFSPALFLQLCVLFSKRCILIQSPFQGLCIQPDSSF